MAIGNQQANSRGSLITSLVIFVILFLVSAVFAVMKHSDYEALKQTVEKDKTKYDKAITSGELAQLTEPMLKDMRESTNKPTASVYAIQSYQLDQLTKAIAGTNKYKDAIESLSVAYNKANQVSGVQTPPNSVINALATYSDAIKNRNDEAAALRKQIVALNKDKETLAEQIGSLNKIVDNVNKQTTQTVSESEKTLRQYREELEAKLKEVSESWTTSTQNSSKNIDELNEKVNNLTLELQQVNIEHGKMVKELSRIKPNLGAEAMLRQPDGKIIRIADKKTVYMDLGVGDHITQGMTFQIYDRAEGLPKLNDEQNDLPPGKASLEVVRVNAGSSECRLMDLQEGQVIQEGDMVANLVYDRNIKPKFVVFGEFDIDHNNVASEQETEIVKRLIVQWGGQLSEKIDIDTDFVVMGKQPEMPSYTKEQIDNDPIIKFTYETARKKMDDYDAIRNKGLDLMIPVLNHNRFLYMIGYWGQGAR